MAASELVAGQGGGQDQERRRVRCLFLEEDGEGDIQGPQPVTFGPAGQDST
jgi:hypothetical protein